MEFIAREARLASSDLAEQRGVFTNWSTSVHAVRGVRLRHATQTSIAPTGISIIAGTSSGIEPLFALAYPRHVLGGQISDRAQSASATPFGAAWTGHVERARSHHLHGPSQRRQPRAGFVCNRAGNLSGTASPGSGDFLKARGQRSIKDNQFANGGIIDRCSQSLPARLPARLQGSDGLSLRLESRDYVGTWARRNTGAARAFCEM